MQATMEVHAWPSSGNAVAGQRYLFDQNNEMGVVVGRETGAWFASTLSHSLMIDPLTNQTCLQFVITDPSK